MTVVCYDVVVVLRLCYIRSILLRFFGSSVIAGHGLPPVTAGIGVWLDGVGQAGMYRTAERMNGRTRLHRCRGRAFQSTMVRGQKEYL